MSTPSSPSLSSLATVPLDRLLETAEEALKRASLNDVAMILSGKLKIDASVDQLAEMILALPTDGSKLDAAQNAVVLHAVAASNGNVSAAARMLGVERKAFERKLARARRSTRA